MYVVKVNDKIFNITLLEDHTYKVNGKTYELDIISLTNHQYHLIVNNKSYYIFIKKADTLKSYDIYINGKLYQTILSDQYDILLKNLGMDKLAIQSTSDLKAPMPGMVIDLMVMEKDKVKSGEPLIILEAMKMENVIKAPTDVIVKKVLAKKGNAVEKNEILIEFEK